ncbi:E3 ubiquitin-protein ligase rififylin [Pieris rapae]|uniref:E3 ubiquitin-protein ligase rififylin n=1 Tax=Pieris rapae TaxID=64459 RepID=UPI001E2817DE|nr:E3 ubiquitin-protein ligase rififylin [Pieris rapae]
MPCESCSVQFSVFKRKRLCSECERYYCSGCLRRGGGTMCAPCRVLSTRPLFRQTIAHLKVRDLQCFLKHQNISTRGCVEKEELLSLCISHVNSSAYRRRGSRTGASPFSNTLKGITNNINEFITSTFDLRNTGHQPPHPDRSNCYNAAHSHTPTGNSEMNENIPDQRFTPTPGGERDVRLPFQPLAPVSRSASVETARVDTTDCFEIEDLEDFGWEFVTPPADPLPTDSAVLITDEEVTELRSAGGRSASDLDLSRGEPHSRPDTASLRDEPLHVTESTTNVASEKEPETARPVSLEQIRRASELEGLTVRQLKELLARNRVEYRGCLERADLLQRAKLLLAEHARCRAEVERLPLEECCKICWAAPLECVLLECGHIAACTDCAKRLPECPICRQYVVRAVRFFRS